MVGLWIEGFGWIVGGGKDGTTVIHGTFEQLPSDMKKAKGAFTRLGNKLIERKRSAARGSCWPVHHHLPRRSNE